MTKWILHITFSALLLVLSWRGLQWVSDAMRLAKRVIRWDVEHGYL